MPKHKWALSRKEIIFLVIVLLAGLFLRSFFLTGDYLVDEAVRINWGNEPGLTERLIEQTPTYSPLIYVWLGTIHAQVNDLALERLLPLVLGMFLVVLAYFFGRHFGLERELALFAALDPHQVIYSVQLSAYIYIIILCLIHSYYLFVNKSYSKWKFFCLGFLLAVGSLFHYVFLAIGFLSVIHFLFSKPIRNKLLYYLSGFALLFIVNLPLFIAQRQFSHFSELFELSKKSLVITLSTVPHFTYLPTMVLLSGVGFYLVWKNFSKQNETIRFICMHAGLFLLIVLVGAFVRFTTFIPRYIILIQPLLVLILFYFLKNGLSTRYYNYARAFYFTQLGIYTLGLGIYFLASGNIKLYY